MDNANVSASMSPVALLPPVSELHDDILLRIFYLNTFTPESEYTFYNISSTSTFDFSTTSTATPAPLTTARYTSQVCRTWRNLIIASPTIWAGMIDLTILENASRGWLREVLKRSGEVTSVAIYGRIGASYWDYRKGFFNYIVGRLWHRTRRFDVTMPYKFMVGDEALDIVFSTPAPQLEVFRLTTASHGPGDPESDGDLSEVSYEKLVSGRRNQGALFANWAPVLGRFHSTMFKLDDNKATWLAGGHLRSMTLCVDDPFTGDASLSDVLRVIGMNCRLESLSIQSPPPLSFSPALSATSSASHGLDNKQRKCLDHMVSLPSLVHLHISGTVNECLFYFQNIVAHPDCAMMLDVEEHVESVHPPDLDFLINIFTPHIAQFFDIHRPTKLGFIYQRPSIRFHAIKGTDMAYFANPETRLSVKLLWGRYHPNMEQLHFMDVLLATLSSLPLDCVTVLHLIKRQSYRAEREMPPEYFKLITALSSVQTLIVDPDSELPPFRVSPERRSAPAFPLLRAIRVYAEGNMAYLPISPNNIYDLCNQRRLSGLPVYILDISGFVWERLKWTKADWRFFDSIYGLKVMWGRGDGQLVHYVCGSGNREVLNWSLPVTARDS